jgi:hypothetical protein
MKRSAAAWKRLIRIHSYYVLPGIVLFLAFSIPGFGQGYPITIDEFQSVEFQAYKKAGQTPRRVESTDLTYTKGLLTKTDLYIWEYESPDRRRTIHRVIENGKSNESEIITIDNVIFRRENGGSWNREEIGNGAGSGGGTGTQTELTHAVKGRVVLDGIEVTLYESVTITKQPDWLPYEEDRIWLDDKDFLIKSEHVSGSMLPRQENYRSVRKYTYDPTIKIKAPIP